MRVESFPLSRGVVSEKPQDLRPVAKAYEEDGQDKPERDRRKDLNRTIDELNKASELFNRHIKFKFNQGSTRSVIQIIDNDTNEVIKEIPPEKMLEMADSIEQAVGLIIDKYV